MDIFNDKIKRAVAFYSSVAIFFFLLPIVLSYSLGYSVDYHTLKIYKTGIIYLKSRPSGASIYLNGRLLPDLTPARIENLKPGAYKVDLKREGFYPWQKDIAVKPNMVTKADEIVLFPLAQDMRKIANYEVTDFVVSDKNQIYYMTNLGLIRSNIDGTNFKRLSLHSNWPDRITGKRFSPDGEKFLYFNSNTIWVMKLNMSDPTAKAVESARAEEILSTPSEIINVFWYSDSRHIVFVTDMDVNVLELDGEGTRNAVMLYKFETRPRALYYDEYNDSLYFTDLKKDQGASGRSYLYRLDLRQKFFTQLIKRLKKEFDAGDEKR